MTDVEVLIVGAGPTGLMTANLLGQAGVEVLVVERHPSTSAEAKAISLDDESVRTMMRAGLEPWLRDIITPGTGTRYYGADRRPLFHARGPEPTPHGHAIKSPFAQPRLEAALLGSLDRFPSVNVVFATEMTGFAQSRDEVEVTVAGPTGSRTVTARYVLGCDGGRSAVRDQLAIPMRGRSFAERWIVIDTVGDSHTERYGIHIGDPRRPEVIIPGTNGRCRYEFLLKPDEDPGDDEDAVVALARSLLSGHRDVRPDDVERTTIYRFHALLAERWRAGRCFLLGDAAHLMPPFAGQGLNSGIRDANNLAWKLVRVLRDGGAPGLLESYEVERRPHAAATIDFSVRMGEVVMTTSRRRAIVRDAVVRAGMAIPPVRRYLEEMRYRPSQRYRTGFVSALEEPAKLTGTALGQPRGLRPDGSVQPLDKILGTGFAVVAVDCSPWPAPPEVEQLAEGFRARRIRVGVDRFPVDADGWLGVTDTDGQLRRQLRRAMGRYLLVRPDRYVAACFTGSQARHVLTELGIGLAAPRPVAAGLATDPARPGTPEKSA